MALNAITMSAVHAAISQKRVLANSLVIAITKATRIHRPKAGSRAAILNRNAATWSLATKLGSEFDRTIADHCSERAWREAHLPGKADGYPYRPRFWGALLSRNSPHGVALKRRPGWRRLMRNTLIGLASLLGLALSPDIAAAQSNTAIGVGTGAVTGAVVGGPVGAVVGGVVVGSVGAATEPRRYRVYRPHRRVAYHRHYRHHPRRYSRY